MSILPPMELTKNIHIDNDYDTQTKHYAKTLSTIESILKDNIDTMNDHNSFNNNINELKNIRDNFIIKNNLKVHNHKPTFIRHGDNLDEYIGNLPCANINPD